MKVNFEHGEWPVYATYNPVDGFVCFHTVSAVRKSQPDRGVRYVSLSGLSGSINIPEEPGIVYFALPVTAPNNGRPIVFSPCPILPGVEWAAVRTHSHEAKILLRRKGEDGVYSVRCLGGNTNTLENMEEALAFVKPVKILMGLDRSVEVRCLGVPLGINVLRCIPVCNAIPVIEPDTIGGEGEAENSPTLCDRRLAALLGVQYAPSLKCFVKQSRFGVISWAGQLTDAVVGEWKKVFYVRGDNGKISIGGREDNVHNVPNPLVPNPLVFFRVAREVHVEVLAFDTCSGLEYHTEGKAIALSKLVEEAISGLEEKKSQEKLEKLTIEKAIEILLSHPEQKITISDSEAVRNCPTGTRKFCEKFDLKEDSYSFEEISKMASFSEMLQEQNFQRVLRHVAATL